MSKNLHLYLACLALLGQNELFGLPKPDAMSSEEFNRIRNSSENNPYEILGIRQEEVAKISQDSDKKEYINKKTNALVQKLADLKESDLILKVLNASKKIMPLSYEEKQEQQTAQEWLQKLKIAEEETKRPESQQALQFIETIKNLDPQRDSFKILGLNNNSASSKEVKTANENNSKMLGDLPQSMQREKMQALNKVKRAFDKSLEYALWSEKIANA
jgi:hypothetical protein